MAAVLKTASGQPDVGSNPTPSALIRPNAAVDGALRVRGEVAGTGRHVLSGHLDPGLTTGGAGRDPPGGQAPTVPNNPRISGCRRIGMTTGASSLVLTLLGGGRRC